MATQSGRRGRSSLGPGRVNPLIRLLDNATSNLLEWAEALLGICVVGAFYGLFYIAMEGDIAFARIACLILVALVVWGAVAENKELARRQAYADAQKLAEQMRQARYEKGAASETEPAADRKPSTYRWSKYDDVIDEEFR